MTPAVSVIVPAKDAAATITATLEALAAQDFEEGFEVVVVDDGSADETRAIAAAADTVVVDGPGFGAGPARNAGVAVARAPLLAFTDADCAPDPGWLSAGVARLRAGTELVQGRVVPAREDPGGPFSRRFWVSRDVGLHETANLFVTREAFDRVAGFQPLLEHLIVGRGRPMGEDTWFGWRLRRSGASGAPTDPSL